MTASYLKAREHDLLDEAERERAVHRLRRQGISESPTGRMIEFARAVSLRLSKARRLIDEMAAADTGSPVPSLRNYPLSPIARQPRRAVGDR